MYGNSIIKYSHVTFANFSGYGDGNNSGSDNSDVDESESIDVKCAHNFIYYNKT